jgi:hypothetical protein
MSPEAIYFYLISFYHAHTLVSVFILAVLVFILASALISAVVVLQRRLSSRKRKNFTRASLSSKPAVLENKTWSTLDKRYLERVESGHPHTLESHVYNILGPEQGLHSHLPMPARATSVLPDPRAHTPCTTVKPLWPPVEDSTSIVRPEPVFIPDQVSHFSVQSAAAHTV